MGTPKSILQVRVLRRRDAKLLTQVEAKSIYCDTTANLLCDCAQISILLTGPQFHLLSNNWLFLISSGSPSNPGIVGYPG